MSDEHLTPMAQRPRRLRRTAAMREAVAQIDVLPRHLMTPYFVVADAQAQQPIAAMPGVSRLGIERLLPLVAENLRLGLNKILLFGVPEAADKNSRATAAYAQDGVVPQAVRALKKEFGADLLVATDVCLCAYTDHGHCGLLHDGHVLNDASLQPLAQMALAHAEAGADLVAPSDMMDGRIGHMRRVLDASGCTDTGIMSYSVKYASAYYGPFREAADCAPGQGDRKSYQMDVRNRREALQEAALDTAEGADWLMVKPAMAFLDIIADLRANSALPLACYNVSGEYSMVKFAAQAGAIDEAAVVRENLIAMRRAGADLVITYHARDAVQHGWLAP